MELNPMAWAVTAGRRTAGALALALAGTMLAVAVAPQADAYPGADDIAAARAAAENQAATVAQLDSAIAQLQSAADQANIAALAAGEDYNVAQAANVQAQQDLFAANARADDADDALEDAKSALAAVALADYRSGGDLASLEAVMTADGFDDVITRTESLDRASGQVDAVLQQVKAAELVATTMRGYAEDAADKAVLAEEQARTTLQQAQQAQEDANDAVQQTQQIQAEALDRLAELNGTTVALEQQRQAGLQAEREAAAAAAAERAREEAAAKAAADKAAQDAANGGSSGGSTSGGSSSGGSSSGGSSSGGSSSGGSSSGGSNDDGGSTGGSTSGGSSSGGSSSGGSSSGSSDDTATGGSSGSSGGSSSGSSGSSGGWSSTASQGSAAAQYAQTLVGAPYAYGGSGPAYDCSGLTQAAWGSAGHYLPHSSRMQYTAVTHVSFSDLRVGDLIFWGTNRNASQIYHVAIYIGNGKVMEATTPGHVAGTRVYNNWAVGDIMPYAGRP
ncbi:NlpC/P60 family protein [Demequina zhanjiangensis]|uniref:C40 family peptidase n=1 Tax=Demequina zhanjiangensis TaxID=3051659 RepID=A0ABT8FYN3_9MICO|nr:C40 family peptidase [Demequina sp. SYSU T00b26]MDN4472001.1 C40 family peptidase [Demequina sp. SYSU T00b26]